MERCSNCGAATRPGAKFCTSCGTRLNLDQDSAQPAASAWSEDASTQDTQIATPPIKWDDVTNDPPASSAESKDDAETSSEAISDVTESTSTDELDNETDEASVEEPVPASSWASAWPSGMKNNAADTTGEANTDDVPAKEEVEESITAGSRFADARDASETEEGSAEPESTFSFPERNAWSWGNTSDDETNVTTEESETFSASTASSEGSSVETDETVIAATAPAPESHDADSGGTRERASALVDELRGLIWTIGEGETSGTGENASILSDLTSVRGETGDYSDLRSLIEAVRDNPRDIDALRDLGRQVDRLQALLDSHSRITSSLDNAIRKLR